jgi:hypothetical protein
MAEATPQTRAGCVVWNLLLRHWRKLDGLTTQEIADQSGLTWEGAWVFMKGLQECPKLPIFLRCDMSPQQWVCNYTPYDLDPVGDAGVRHSARAGVIAHRLILRGILLGETGWRRGEIAALASVTPAIATQILSRMSGNGGIPLSSRNGVWSLDLTRFLAVRTPFKDEISQIGCGTIYDS